MARSALCIGINDYPGTDSDLQGCVNDAHDWAGVLRQRGYSVEMMLDSQATLDNMVRRMTGHITEASAGDTVIITYSGHGTWVPDVNGDEPDARDEALCPHDVNTRGPLTDDMLYQIFTKRARGVKLIFVSDSCHSGSVSRFANLDGNTAEQSKIRYLAPEVYMTEGELKMARQTRHKELRTLPMRTTSLLMSGCRDYEYSYDAYFNGRYNGAFTYVALRALAGLPETATYRDWMNAVRTQLPSQQYPQTPILSGTYDQRTWQVLS